MAKLSASEFFDRCAAELERAWSAVAVDTADDPLVPENIQSAIDRSINSQTKTYRYVLPTQTLAKTVDPALDARSLQEGSELPGAFDARSLCHRIIVPFDRVRSAIHIFLFAL
jgi:hypothetical protein